MRQASKRIPESAEKAVRDIRRATRRHHSAEEKIRCFPRAASGRGFEGRDANQTLGSTPSQPAVHGGRA